LVGPFSSDTIVLCYHALSEDPRAEMVVAPSTLEAHVKALLKRGYRAKTFGEVVLHGTGDEKEFAVTFDDAFESVSRLGRPILDRLGVPATVFVCTDFVSSQQPMSWPAISEWARQQPRHEMLSMSWAELRDAQEAGWEIGSHTCSHPRLTGLSDEELARELGTSRAICEEQLGKSCTSLAYPQSDFDARVIDFAERVGYTAACTLPSEFTAPTRYAWPRIGVYEIDDWLRFRLKSSPLIRRIRTSRLGALERRLRRSA
jgi:peptidoglycan/xylan/chitin deacetylase (PgdA/CDA1 family)